MLENINIESINILQILYLGAFVLIGSFILAKLLSVSTYFLLITGLCGLGLSVKYLQLPPALSITFGWGILIIPFMLFTIFKVMRIGIAVVVWLVVTIMIVNDNQNDLSKYTQWFASPSVDSIWDRVEEQPNVLNLVKDKFSNFTNLPHYQALKKTESKVKDYFTENDLLSRFLKKRKAV